MYTRINAVTGIPDPTPLPYWMAAWPLEYLLDTSWLDPTYNGGETNGYNWYPSTDTTEYVAIGMFQRYVGPVYDVVDLVGKTVSFHFEVEDWTPAEIAAYKLAQYQAAAEPIAQAYEGRANQIANLFDFFGATPMLTALSFQGSTLAREAARAAVLATWRDEARAVCQEALAGVLATGVPVYDVVPLLPVAPTIPEDPEPE